MNELTPLLEAWRVMRLGTREVVDGLVVVVGDQPLTDGLLAARLGGTFVLVCGAPAPIGPSAQRAIGHALKWLLRW